jgi:hypothetical protein
MADRNWYVAPVLLQEIGDGTRVVPGHGDPMVAFDASGAVCRAYDEVAGTMLVGLKPRASMPSGWTALTLENAETHYQTVTGRSPTGVIT